MGIEVGMYNKARLLKGKETEIFQDFPSLDSKGEWCT
jgi:hypothetical protein